MSDTGTPLTVEWTSLVYPVKNIQEGCESMNLPGTYICRYSHDSHILAVAVNQKSPAQTSLLYVSPFTETVMVADMKGCGLKDAATRRGR